MAYRAAADTSNPWTPLDTQAPMGLNLGTRYGQDNFPLPYGQGDWRRVMRTTKRSTNLSGFYQKDSFVLPYGQWTHSRRRTSSCSCPGNPTPSKMATKMAASISAPAPVVSVAPSQQNPCGGSLAAGLAIGAGILWAAYNLLK